MPTTSFPEYARDIADTLNKMVEAGDADSLTLQVDQRSSMQGFIAGSLQFTDGSILHFREFVDLHHLQSRLMYAYQYQDASADLISRYDNAAHRPALSQAEHKHTPSAIEPAPAPTLTEVLNEILKQR